MLWLKKLTRDLFLHFLVFIFHQNKATLLCFVKDKNANMLDMGRNPFFLVMYFVSIRLALNLRAMWRSRNIVRIRTE